MSGRIVSERLILKPLFKFDIENSIVQQSHSQL